MILILPATSTGDLCHVAMAMILDKNLQVCVQCCVLEKPEERKLANLDEAIERLKNFKEKYGNKENISKKIEEKRNEHARLKEQHENLIENIRQEKIGENRKEKISQLTSEKDKVYKSKETISNEIDKFRGYSRIFNLSGYVEIMQFLGFFIDLQLTDRVNCFLDLKGNVRNNSNVIEAAKKTVSPDVYDYWISTPVICYQMKQKNAFPMGYYANYMTQGSTDKLMGSVKEIVGKIIPPDGQYFLFMIRAKNDHPEHNTKPCIIRQVVAELSESNPTVRCIFIGTKGQISENEREFISRTKIQPEYKEEIWSELLNLSDPDIQSEFYLFGDKRAQVIFWQEVLKSERCVGLIGGTSGSVDIAAFAGVRVLSWTSQPFDDVPEDVRHPLAQEQVRLKLQQLWGKNFSIIYKQEPWGYDGDNLLNKEELQLWLTSHEVNKKKINCQEIRESLKDDFRPIFPQEYRKSAEFFEELIDGPHPSVELFQAMKYVYLFQASMEYNASDQDKIELSKEDKFKENRKSGKLQIPAADFSKGDLFWLKSKELNDNNTQWVKVLIKNKGFVKAAVRKKCIQKKV